MTNFLILIVLVLLSIAIWQLTKIFDLTQSGSTQDDSQVATDKDNDIQGYLMFGFLAFLYIFTIYGLVKWGHFVLHTPASAHGDTVDSLMNASWVVIFFVQAITQVLLHYFSFKYRGKEGNNATFFADNNRLELIWSGIPAVVLAGLISYGLFAWSDIMYVNEEDDAIEIEIYAQQFNWTVRYAGPDNVLGKANVRLIEGVNILGVDLSDPNAADDIVLKELHIPKGKKVHFKMRSQDVLHSAYFPHFRAQMNCVPGMVTEFAFTPIYTTDEYRSMPFMIEKVNNINKIRNEKSKELVAKGQPALDAYNFDYLLLCNKICGASHYNMQMKVVVDTPADFKEWLSDKTSIVEELKASNAPAPESEGSKKDSSATVATADSSKIVMK